MDDKGRSTEANNGPIQKQDGTTDTERYLARLCKRSFLSLWSYPGVYRDQGQSGSGHGKEVCDLLVVFGDDVIVFSDKYCAFPNSGNLAVDWSRWFRRAVVKSAAQVWGAERWIRQFPNRLFLDKACTTPFPLALSDINQTRFHRVVVAHGSADRCKEIYGGSGSLMIRTDLRGKAHFDGAGMPFQVGHVEPHQGFVHILDDTTLDIVLETLTTTADFVAYLTKKEAFLTGETTVFAAGEEELLAFYLRDINEHEEHDFMVPPGHTHIALGEGHWEDFVTSKARAAQLSADEVSYVWDVIIEKFSGHILDGTSALPESQPISHHEQAVRWLAKEGRTVRRLLATSLLDLIHRTPTKPGIRATRVMPSPRPGSPYYTFLIAGTFDGLTEEQYREFRRMLLQAQCMVVKLRYPEARDIVGFATEPRDSIQRSEDLLYLDGRLWTPEMEAKAKDLQSKTGLLTELHEVHRETVYEYPKHPGR